MRPARCLLLALLALAIVPTGASAATTFGANLSLPPNSEFDCSVHPNTFLPTGADSCTWWTTGRIDDTSEGNLVPAGGGTIVAARVRVGPVTGPMQFVVIRSIRHPKSLADPGCCFPVGHSEVFTPAPNSVMTVPMNVPVRNEVDPASGLENFDAIALSVLSPVVPVPAYDTGDRSLGAPAGGGFYPSYVPGTERSTGLFAVVGFQTLINADLEPPKAADPAPVGPTVTGPTDLVGLGDVARVRNGRALVPLRCASPAACAGLLRLQSLPLASAGASAAARQAPRRTYGKLRFRIAPGKRKLLRVRLNRSGKRLTGKHRRLRAYGNVWLAGGKRDSERLVLRR